MSTPTKLFGSFLLLTVVFFVFLQQIDDMLAGSLSQEDEDAVLAELEAITQVSPVLFDSLHKWCSASHFYLDPDLFPFWFLVSQGVVELPDVPSDKLPEVPEATEDKPGLLNVVFSLSCTSLSSSCVCNMTIWLRTESYDHSHLSLPGCNF